MLTLSSLTAFAGNEGGGGMVVACYKDGELTTVELLDLYEGKAKGLKLQEYSGDFEADINSIATKVKKGPESARRFAEGIIRLSKSYTQIPVDAELELTNDALPTFLPRGCKAKQVANFYNYSLIWLDSVLFNKMSYRDQLALAVHEFIYSIERGMGVSNSRYARTITSLALSTKDPFKATRVKNPTYRCQSKVPGKFVFMAEPIEGERNKWIFDFDYINGHVMYAKKSGIVIVSENSPLGDSGGSNDVGTFSTAELDSEVNPNEMLVVFSSSTRMYLSWAGTDPGDRFVEEDFTCYEVSEN